MSAEDGEVTRRGPGRPRKEESQDPMLVLMKQLADQNAASAEMMGRILGDQEARKRSEEEKEQRLARAVRWVAPPGYEEQTWDHIDPKEEMERALSPGGHFLGAVMRPKGDTERIPPLIPDENQWVSSCRNCGLGVYFRWMGRPANDPRSRDPRAKKIITGFTVGGQAFQHTCANAVQLAQANMSPVINKDAMRPVLQAKV